MYGHDPVDGPVDAAADALVWRPGPPDGDRTAALVGAVDAGAVLLLLLLWPVLRWWGCAIGAALLAGQLAGLRMLRARQRRLVVECELRPGRGTARFVLHGGAEQVVPFAALRRIDLTHRGERGARGTRSTADFGLEPAPAPSAGTAGGLRTARTVVPEDDLDRLRAFAERHGVRYHEEERLPAD
ncbi:hypothetical protein [Kitasatospora arboriphila]|uniref:PH domain-containing protein n=1 Tax=Kitasatospora arboriphila TaxID=258052 RepID=A0ABN1U1T7_9ACTN